LQAGRVSGHFETEVRLAGAQPRPRGPEQGDQVGPQRRRGAGFYFRWGKELHQPGPPVQPPIVGPAPGDPTYQDQNGGADQYRCEPGPGGGQSLHNVAQ